MRLSDMGTISLIIDNYNDLNGTLKLLSDSKSLTLKVYNQSSEISSSIKVICAPTKCPEIYQDFNSELSALIEKRKSRLRKLLNDYGVECSLNELEGK